MTETTTRIIRTPDQRLRVFVSSTLQELAEERRAAREAIERLHLAPVMFELGARPHPPKDLYRAYLDQSHIFIGIYWQKYGWVAPDMDVSGLEDEYNLSGQKPKLIYFKSPAPDREARLKDLIDRIRSDDRVSYKAFATPAELRDLIENDLAMMLTESFESTRTAERPTAATSLPARRANLPMPPTPLIDREAEQAALHDLLLRADAPLITLIGPGGIGKSRLALQVALDSIEHFGDGAFLVPLATIGDPAQLPAAIANALALHESVGRASLTDGLIDYVRDKHLLLILDNFEHIIDAAPLVATLLQACTQLKIVTTSRMPLRVRGEREFAVGPLELPQPSERAMDAAALEALSHCSAIALFVQRAHQARSTFALTSDNAETIAEICRRLDGLPLAIELAAARTRVLTPTELLRRLSISLDVLSGGARDLPERQRTLHNAITWSYNLLDPVRQRLFRRLSVFANGWTLEAAEEICNAQRDLDGDIFDHIAMLVDNSLILRADTADGEPRFHLLQTMRDYAREALSEGGEEFDVQRRHAEYFLTLAVDADQQLRGPDQLRWLDRLEVEYANVRAAFEWFLAQPNRLDAAIGLAGALGWFWYVRGRWTEGRHWLDEALTRQAATGSTQGRARALNMLGLLAAHQGDSAVARASLKAGIELARQTHDLPRLAYGLAILSLETQWRENLAEARAIGAESIALFREIGDQWGLAYALYIDGMAAFWQGDHIATRKAYTESIALFRAVGARWRAAGPLGRLGDLDYRQGDYPAARALYEESRRLYRELNDLPGIASALNPLGDVARALGDLDQAVAYYQESVSAHQQLGDKYALAWAMHGLAVVAAQRRDFDQAIALLPRVIALLSEVGDSGGVPWAMKTLGYVKVDQGNFAGAKIDFEVALQLARNLNHEVTLAFCLPGLARSLLGLQQPDRAARLIGQAEAMQSRVAAHGSATDKAEYERRLTEARAQIETAQWAAAIDAGRGLSLAQALEMLIVD